MDKVYIVFQRSGQCSFVHVVLTDEEIAKSFVEQFNLINVGFEAYYREYKILREF